MAIDAFEGRQMLPDHDLLIIDEGHELTDRVTSTITDELTAGTVAAAAKRAGRLADTSELTDAGTAMQAVLDELPEGRMTGLPDRLVLALGSVRDAARALQSELKPSAKDDSDGGRQVARAAVEEIFDTAERVLEERELDVAWITQERIRGAVLHVAPMSVAMLLRDKLFSERTVVLTSATLELGGSFDAVAGTLGLTGSGAPAWSGLDVGSPFNYKQQAIAYVAKDLPPPGRDGTSDKVFDEIESLVRAAGGRTLGLFSSRRAAEAASEQLRTRLADTPITVLCQGDDQTPTLVRQFAADATTCLFGTMSLWQGVDVPGSACQLVIIDRIPFPRPDDPLASARSEAIGRMGGNGFMQVSATHAALKLAQGSGRLVRRGQDRGVVAFLDSRMMTARYAGFLQKSLPPFWPTTSRQMVLDALRRLDQTAPDPLPVAEPVLRGSAGPVSGATGRGTDVVPAPTADPPPVARSPRTAVTGGHAWTADQDEELRDAVEAGIDLAEVAEHLQLPPDAVTTRLNQLGLELADGRLLP
jgi:ATP-dependent DNA helicase DinG